MKQIAAITGFLLILFIITHLGGNLLIYAGPEIFNSYAHKLHSFGPLLLIARALLLIIFLLHIFVIHILVIQNIKARRGRKRHDIDQAVDQRTLAERIMPWSGLYILVFVIFHILDFAAADQHGPRTLIHGISYGLYGLVFNSFRNPVHGSFYIIAVFLLGMHLSHGVRSIIQSCGFHPRWEPFIQKCSDYFAVIMIFGFISIPVYIYWLSH